MDAVPTPLQTLDAARVLPAVAAQDQSVLHAWADACVVEGIPALELFLRGADAEPAVIAAIRSLATSHPGLAVGAGDVAVDDSEFVHGGRSLGSAWSGLGSEIGRAHV